MPLEPAPTASSTRTVSASYFTSYASPSRSGRVRAPTRLLGSLARVTLLDGPPRFVLVNGAGDHVVVDRDESYEVYASSGALASRDTKIPNVPPLVWDTSLLVDGAEHHFSGQRGGLSLLTGINPGDRAWAIEVGDGVSCYVVQKRPRHFQRGEPIPGTSQVATVYDETANVFSVESVHGFNGWKAE